MFVIISKLIAKHGADRGKGRVGAYSLDISGGLGALQGYGIGVDQRSELKSDSALFYLSLCPIN